MDTGFSPKFERLSWANCHDYPSLWRRLWDWNQPDGPPTCLVLDYHLADSGARYKVANFQRNKVAAPLLTSRLSRACVLATYKECH